MKNPHHDIVCEDWQSPGLLVRVTPDLEAFDLLTGKRIEREMTLSRPLTEMEALVIAVGDATTAPPEYQARWK